MGQGLMTASFVDACIQVPRRSHRENTDIRDDDLSRNRTRSGLPRAFPPMPLIQINRRFSCSAKRGVA